MRNIIAQAFIIAILIASSSLHAEKMRIAVIDFQAKGIPETDALKVTELIRNEMINIGKFIVIERVQMGEILKEQGLQQSGCTDVSCAVQVGKVLSARKILVGTVMSLGSKIIITGRIVDVEKGIADTEDDLYSAVASFCKELSNRIDVKHVVIKKEEEPVSESIFSGFKYNITAGFNYMTAFGDFKDLVETGMGGSLTLSADIMWNLSVGLASGYYRFSGKEEQTDNLTLIPFLAAIGYRYTITRQFFVMPVISGGGIYASLTQNDETKSEVQNLFRAGLCLGYLFWKDLYVHATAEYNTIFEQDGMVNFVTYSAGVGWRL